MAKGDIAIYYQSSGAAQTISATPSFTIHTFASKMVSQGDYADSTGTLIDLEAGYHLLGYSVIVDTTTTTNVRSETQCGIVIGSIASPATPSDYGQSTGYMRHYTSAEDIQTAYIGGSTIIKADSATTAAIKLQITSSISVTNKTVPLYNAIHAVNLGTTLNCLRARETGGGQAFSTNTFEQMTWDTSDEADAAYFTDDGAGNFTIKNAGQYLVFVNVSFNNAGTTNNDRGGAEFELRINGGAVQGSRSSAFMRGASSCQDYVANFAGVIKTFTANAVLTVWCRDNSTPALGKITVNGTGNGIVVVALPSDVETFSFIDTDGTQDVDTAEEVDFAQTRLLSTGAFSRDNNWRTQYEKAGKFLHFYNFYAERTSTDNVRQYPYWSFVRDWFSEDSFLQVADRGTGGGYLRGDVTSQPPGVTYKSGFGTYLDFLAIQGHLHAIKKNDDSTGTDATSVYAANRSRWDGICLNTWLSLPTEVGRYLVPNGDSSIQASNWTRSKGGTNYVLVDSGAAFPDRTPDLTTWIQNQGVNDFTVQLELSDPPAIYFPGDQIWGVTIRMWMSAVFNAASSLTYRVGLYDSSNTVIAQSGFIDDLTDDDTAYQYSVELPAEVTISDMRTMEFRIERATLNPGAVTRLRLFDVRIEYQMREHYGSEKTITASSHTEKTIPSGPSKTEKTIGSTSHTPKTISSVSQTEKTIDSVTHTEKEIDL